MLSEDDRLSEESPSTVWDTLGGFVDSLPSSQLMCELVENIRTLKEKLDLSDEELDKYLRPVLLSIEKMVSWDFRYPSAWEIWNGFIKLLVEFDWSKVSP
jgi:hypothetical protein